MGATIKGMDRLRRELEKKVGTGAPKVSAGVWENAKNKITGELVAPYAAANEFGAVIPVTDKMRGFFFHRFGIRKSNKPVVIPPRPFMRHTFETKRKQWVENLRKALAGGASIMDALNLVGMRMAQDIQATIKSDMPPPNSELTVAHKNADMGTLMATGSLHRSITHRVEE